MNSVSLEEKFCKYFKKLRWPYNEVEVSFNIDDLKIKVSLYSDQKLNFSKEKRDLDLLAKKVQLYKVGWESDSKVITRHLGFNYSDVLFDRPFRYVTTFEFIRNRQTDKTNLNTELDAD